MTTKLAKDKWEVWIDQEQDIIDDQGRDEPAEVVEGRSVESAALRAVFDLDPMEDDCKLILHNLTSDTWHVAVLHKADWQMSYSTNHTLEDIKSGKF